jgi:hypothetical protein
MRGQSLRNTGDRPRMIKPTHDRGGPRERIDQARCLDRFGGTALRAGPDDAHADRSARNSTAATFFRAPLCHCDAKRPIRAAESASV